MSRLLSLLLFCALVTGGAARAAEVQERVRGNPDAPVTMIEYSSLTCPHCAAFHQETLPALKERYIDTGKVKHVMRDFPLDQYALQAAVVAHCAGPDRYFTFLDALFAAQQNWARASNPTEALKQFARLGGLPPEQVDACLADQAMQDAVLQIRLEGEQQYNIRSTPSFIINGELFAGARTIDGFAEIIDPLVAQ
ncbi:MAG TPA: DsbA family protein [Geminicoccaceae bacterium]|nr:DsbA family protein [Geminicoccaceae bacterium]